MRLLVVISERRDPWGLSCIQEFLKSVAKLQVHARVLDARTRTAVAMGGASRILARHSLERLMCLKPLVTSYWSQSKVLLSDECGLMNGFLHACACVHM